MMIVSVNVGLPRDVPWKGKSVTLVAAVVLFVLVQGLTVGAITVEGGTLSEETNA